MHVFCRFLAGIFRKSSFLTREYIFVITTKGINVNNPKKNRELGIDGTSRTWIICLAAHRHLEKSRGTRKRLSSKHNQ